MSGGPAAAFWEFLAQFAVEILILLVTIIGYGVRVLYKKMSEIEDHVDEVEQELELQSHGQTRLERHNTRMEELQKTQNRLMRYMVGDANDPSDAGLLHEIEEIHQKVDSISDNLGSDVDVSDPDPPSDD